MLKFVKVLSIRNGKKTRCHLNQKKWLIESDNMSNDGNNIENQGSGGDKTTFFF